MWRRTAWCESPRAIALSWLVGLGVTGSDGLGFGSIADDSQGINNPPAKGINAFNSWGQSMLASVPVVD
jgi:hypothetical protein